MTKGVPVDGLRHGAKYSASSASDVKHPGGGMLMQSAKEKSDAMRLPGYTTLG